MLFPCFWDCKKNQAKNTYVKLLHIFVILFSLIYDLCLLCLVLSLNDKNFEQQILMKCNKKFCWIIPVETNLLIWLILYIRKWVKIVPKWQYWISFLQKNRAPAFNSWKSSSKTTALLIFCQTCKCNSIIVVILQYWRLGLLTIYILKLGKNDRNFWKFPLFYFANVRGYPERENSKQHTYILNFLEICCFLSYILTWFSCCCWNISNFHFGKTNNNFWGLI